ncbi:hypothetical protein DL98DRAFT_57962 [Cadophora sp. DSE1049]|nr:hypothetical protein DL98DRAFT_57962 [Cadophora sp. DSE1049]
MPDFLITARADATPTSHWVTIPGATFTSTILLGPSPAPTPPPTASSSPSRGTVIGAVVGSIFGFLLVLFLVWAFVRTSRADWVPRRRGSIDEVYIANPNVAPVRLAVVNETTVYTATKVVIEKTETSHRFVLVRPSKKRERPPVKYSDSSESSMSSDHS